MKRILLLSLLFLIGCSETAKKPAIEKLVKQKTIKVDVNEPSDLAVSYDGKFLWTVSDDDGTIYKLNFDGKVVKRIKTEFYDLEGVTVLDSNKLAIAVEEERKIAILDTLGKVLKEVKLHLDGEYNKGLEGIVFNPDNKHFYAVNEKFPALLIELDKNFNPINEIEINELKDLSAVTYDIARRNLILLSDESKTVAVCDLSGKILKKYSIQLQQAEGICLHQGKLYIISDPKAEIYVYEY